MKIDELLNEESKSKKQQRFMGMVHAAQTGEKPASKEVAKVAKTMKKSDVKDFAKTKHKGLPNKKIQEAPLPDDFDKSKFHHSVGHDERLDYVKQKVDSLGKGSSRHAFSIGDTNKKQTALKVTIDEKGYAQNAAEILVLSDQRVQDLGITAKLIDFDISDDGKPTWVNIEHCDAIGPYLGEMIGCIDVDQLIDIALMYTGKKNNTINVEIKRMKEDGIMPDEVERCLYYADALSKLQLWHGVIIEDFRSSSNWGINSQGNPVVIDLGFTNDVAAKYYRRFLTTSKKMSSHGAGSLNSDDMDYFNQLTTAQSNREHSFFESIYKESSEIEDSPENRVFRFKDTSIRYNVYNGSIFVAAVRTTVDQRGEGSARAAMVEFLRQADAMGLPIKLFTIPLDKTTKHAKLLKFYKSLGFQETGRVVNRMGHKELVRPPSTSHSDIDITEAPLPDDSGDFEPEQKPFDKEVLAEPASYRKRIQHAVDRVQKLGKGSSRTAFTVKYQGRPTVLKIAHNTKGSAQNEVEASILDDYYVESLGITPPLIDYDTDNDQPTWIHMEQANKATEKQLCNLMKCGKLSYLVQLAGWYAGTQRMMNADNIKQYLVNTYKYTDDDLETLDEYAGILADLRQNYDIQLADFTRAANWGIYNGNPVVVDIGFNDGVRTAHYS